MRCTCGNHEARQGTLSLEAAQDFVELTHEALDRQFTEPKRLLLAKERCEKRRNPPRPAHG